ncbi:MAG: nif-specific transcriptional activator NifA [Rhodocyclaceae bacterium]
MPATMTAPRDRTHIELVTIYEISKLLTASLDVSRTLREALNVLVQHMGFRRAMIVLENERGDALDLVAAVGLSADEWDGGHYESGEGVIGRVFASGSPVVIADIRQEPLYLNRTGSLPAAGEEEVIAFVGVPMRTSGELVGVLSIDRPANARGEFSRDVRLLFMVANLIGQTVALQRLVVDERERLMLQSKRARREVPRTRFRLNNVVGASRVMQDVFAQVHQVAPARSTVLLRGESGTGKEVIARAIHELSPRRAGPFIKLNCAALSESLLESELFGHEKGAFTGAANERKGRFELANGGTLFLDEIGDVSPSFQTKLLRVLQEREFERVGGSRPIKVDVRLVCATNRNLEQMVSAETFRADLYFRINVVSIFLPPLRERREDIPALVKHFLDRFNAENARQLTIGAGAQEMLLRCYWPGNVRELENCIERGATMALHDELSVDDFPCTSNRCMTQMLHFTRKDAIPLASAPAPVVAHVPDAVETPAPMPAAPVASGMDSAKPEGERERLIWAMEQCGWVQARAARLLRITPRQMGYALQKYDIQVRRF